MYTENLRLAGTVKIIRGLPGICIHMVLCSDNNKKRYNHHTQEIKKIDSQYL